ncbi:MAG: hypothetical protein NTX41_05885 [Verrucomicrobia bacterium]|nr:hypothetical protein [Verrucomicrobiota bacterium]
MSRLTMTRLLFILLTSWGLIGCGQQAANPSTETTPIVVPSAPPASTSGYIKYWPGTLPIVISVPHDGAVMPLDIPDRTEGVTVRDSYARALAEAIRAALTKKFGRAPHLIVCEISRKKVDCNRELAVATQGHPKAIQAWQEYHGCIDRAEQSVLAQTPHGLYLDIHSHGHPNKRIEIGYLLKSADLKLTDHELDTDETVRARSSIRLLGRLTPTGFTELVRGQTSLGGLLEARGLAAVPSPKQTLAVGEPYFNGAFDIAAHGSRDKAQLDGIQLEVPVQMRDTAEHRAATALALADALEVYFERHFRMKLTVDQVGR